MAETRRPAGVHTARVIRVTANGPIVEVPRLAQGFEEGPLLSCVVGLAAGDRVIVAALAHDPDALVVLGRLT